MAYFKSLSINATSTRRLPFQLYNTSDADTGLPGIGVTYGEVDGVAPLGMEDQTDYIIYADGDGDWLAVLELDFDDTNFDLNTNGISGCKIYMCKADKLPDNTSSLNSQGSSYIPPDWSSAPVPQGEVGQGANSFGLEASYQAPEWSLPGSSFGLESSYRPPAWSSGPVPVGQVGQGTNAFGLEGVSRVSPQGQGVVGGQGVGTGQGIPSDSKPSDNGSQSNYINKYMIIGDINVTQTIDKNTGAEIFVYSIIRQNFTGDVYAEQALYVSSDNGDEKFFADYGSIDLVDTTYAMNIQSNTITLYDVGANGGGMLDVRNAGEFLEFAIDDNGITSIYGFSGDQGTGPSFEIISDDTGTNDDSGGAICTITLLSGDEAENLEMQINDSGTTSIYGFSGMEGEGPWFELLADDTGENPASTFTLSDGDEAEKLELQIDGVGTASIYGFSGMEGEGPWFEILADDTGENPVSTFLLSDGDEAEKLELQIDGLGTTSIYGFAGGEGEGPSFEIISDDNTHQSTVILVSGDQMDSLEMQIDESGYSSVYGFSGGDGQGDAGTGPNFELIADDRSQFGATARLTLDAQAGNGIVSYNGSTNTQSYGLILNEAAQYSELILNSTKNNNNLSMSIDSVVDTCYIVAGVNNNSQNFSLSLDGQSNFSSLAVFGETESLTMQVDNAGISAIAGAAASKSTTFDITANDPQGQMQINGGVGMTGTPITFQLLADDNNNEASLILYDGSTTNTTTLNTSSLTTINENGPGVNLDVGDSDVSLNLSDDYNNFGDSNNSILNTTALTITNAGGTSATLEVNDGDAFLYLDDGAGNTTTINTTEISMTGDNPTITINDNGQTVILDSPPEGNATWQQLTVCVNGVSKTMYVFGTTPN